MGRTGPFLFGLDKPFVVDGQPVEVDTTAGTTFNLMP